MDHDIIQLMSKEVYDFVFNLLDKHPDTTGDECGKVATAVEQLFHDRALEVLE